VPTATLTTKPARSTVQSAIRIEPALYERARTAAAHQQISLNAWIVLAMEAQLAQEERRRGR
jgi:predicted HicB family RNase H-like nuclease